MLDSLIYIFKSLGLMIAISFLAVILYALVVGLYKQYKRDREDE